jgi:hypothetical protein
MVPPILVAAAAITPECNSHIFHQHVGMLLLLLL